MKLIATKDVIIPENRQRTFFLESDINELAEDLLLPHGMLHSIVLRNDCRTLVSGERRLCAVQYLARISPDKMYAHEGVYLSVSSIPYTILHDLPEDQLEEAELSENTKRVDLSWREKAIAISRLVELRRRQNPNISDGDIMREIIGSDTNNSPTSLIKDNVVLANNLHRPAVRNAKSKPEALKILTKELNQEFTVLMAERFEAQEFVSKHTLIKGSCLTWMSKLQENSFDCILTDPPYGINANSSFGSQPALTHEYNDTPENAWAIFKSIADEAERVCKKQAHMYIFCDFSYFFLMQEYLNEETSWKVWSRPLIWAKNNGIAPQPNYGPRNTYECILYANLGRRETLGLFHDVLQITDIKDKVHAAQKPVEVFAELLKRTCRPGDYVLDPCCGSGTIFPAASRTSVRATGIELETNAHAFAHQRLGEE